jgi:DNA-binding winged helix-turn-helix (wHTH) protein
VRVHFGEFVFDSDGREIARRGEPLHLTPKAFDLLRVLISESPRAVAKHALMDVLWPDVVVQDANLKNLIAEIRGALGADVVRTVPRFGYAFAARAETTSARLLSTEHTWPLRPGENVIGRGDDCSVVLDFIGVSRHHARITVDSDRFVLEDLGSKNGTWRNDERVTRSIDLRDGDRIRIGAMSFVFRSAGQGAATATIT